MLQVGLECIQAVSLKLVFSDHFTQSMNNYSEWKNRLEKCFALEEVSHDKIDGTEQCSYQDTFPLQRKFELSELCEIFVGKWLKYVYLLILLVFTFLVSPGYASIAASAWSVNIPIHTVVFDECTDEDFNEHILPDRLACRSTYWLCLCLFALIVVPLSLIQPKQQASIQVVFGVLRFGVLIAMALHCMVMLFGRGCSQQYDVMLEEEQNCSNTSLYYRSSNLKASLIHFDWKSWLSSIPLFVFSVLLHQAIPSLTHPIRQKNLLRGHFNAVFITVGAIYVLLGILVALYFQDTINESAILNWVS